MNRITKYIVGYLVLIPLCLSSQIQRISGTIIRDSQVKQVQIDSNSYIYWGHVNVEDTLSDWNSFWEIDKDSTATIETRLDTGQLTNVFVGYRSVTGMSTFGVLYRNDSCFVHLDSVLQFVVPMLNSDTFEIIKCTNGFELKRNGQSEFSTTVASFTENYRVAQNVIDADTVRNTFIEYYYGGDCGSTPGGPPGLAYFKLKYDLTPGYAISTRGRLGVAYRERYAITPDSDTAIVIINGLTNPTFTDTLEITNFYGHNEVNLDLKNNISAIHDDLYVLKLLGTNKNRELLLKFKYNE